MEDQVKLFNELVAQIATGQGTFRESGEQGKSLMEMCAQFPDEIKLVTLKNFLDVILRESFNIVAARQYCSEFASTILTFSPDVRKQIIPYALDKMQSRVISFEEQIFALRECLAKEYENEQDWVQAAKILALIPVDSGQKQYSKEVKLELNLKIGQLYLEAEEYIEAETFIQKVGMILDSTVDESYRIRHSACFARIQDFRRKYVEASQRYYDLSRRPAVAEGERRNALLNAVNCILLAPASPQRARILAVFVKDERILELPTYGFFRKVLEGRTIKRAEVEQLASHLQPHQRDALTPDGQKLLERIVLEHNILSSKKYFRVVSFEALSRLLDIPAHKLEKILVNMVSEGRLKVKINHINNSVTFEQDHPLNCWDKKLEQICMQANKVSDMIAQRHPDWVIEQQTAPTSG